MGTRRSRHNRGRKPLYKEHRRNLLPDTVDAFNEEPILMPTAALIMRNPKYGGGWYDMGCRWDDRALGALRVLCAAKHHVDASANAIGRPPTTLAHKACDLRLLLPPSWAAAISNPKPRGSSSHVLLCYPYVEKPRPEHADLLRVNELVPKSMPDWMRADICQEIMLGLLENKTTLEELERNKDNVKWFTRKFNKEYRPWHEIQVGDRFGDDDRAFDEIAAARNLKSRCFSAMHSHTDATQEDHIFQQEVSQTVKLAHMRGVYVSRDEAQYALEGGHWTEFVGTFANPQAPK